jgi:transketolase
MHTIKPLDAELVLQLAKDTGAILTVEEHMVNGGLGEACASLLLQNGYKKPFKIMGIPDEYTVTGSQVEILGHYGLSADGIAQAVINMGIKAQ